MRKLKTSDIPEACRVLKKLGIKDMVREIAQSSDNIKDVWAKGFDLVWNVFDIATEKNGEKYLYEFFAGPFEMTPEEVENLDISVLFDNLKKLAEENDLADFFKLAGKSMK